MLVNPSIDDPRPNHLRKTVPGLRDSIRIFQVAYKRRHSACFQGTCQSNITQDGKFTYANRRLTQNMCRTAKPLRIQIHWSRASIHQF